MGSGSATVIALELPPACPLKSLRGACLMIVWGSSTGSVERSLPSGPALQILSDRSIGLQGSHRPGAHRSTPPRPLDFMVW